MIIVVLTRRLIERFDRHFGSFINSLGGNCFIYSAIIKDKDFTNVTDKLDVSIL